MNKFIQNLFLILLPFYPLWARVWVTITHTSFSFLIGAALIPMVLYLIIFNRKKIPVYLIFLILFTIYHFVSVIVNDTSLGSLNVTYFVISDDNLQACLFFIIIEHTVFDKLFIKKLTWLILLLVIISLVVSIIQIKIPGFFFNTALDQGLIFADGNRCTSIYSWTNINSVGITFPLLISILVSLYQKQKSTLPFIVFSGIVVSFLTKARYVMISGIVVLSQLFLSTRLSVIKKTSIVIMLLVGLYMINIAANNLGYDIKDVVENRILEKGNDMGSAKARIRSYEVFLKVFPENPWFGVGPETKKNVIDMLEGVAPLIHVGYLSYLYYYGIVGCLLLFLAIFFLLKYAWEIGKKHNFWGTFYGLISFCLANLTFVYFNLSELGIVISLVYLRYFKYKSSVELFERLLKMRAILPKEAQLIATK
jgi:hypothetical protein